MAKNSGRPRVAHICTYPDGGAGIAARRLHEGLLAAGVASSFLYLAAPAISMQGSVAYEHHPGWMDKLHHYLGGKREARLTAKAKEALLPGYDWFSSPYSPLRPELQQAVRNADIVHLHWAADFLHWPTFFSRIIGRGQKLVWTLHDQNPFTGGCHYTGGCTQWRTQCRLCPQLDEDSRELVADFFATRQSALRYVERMQVVAPSAWLSKLAGESALLGRFEHKVIPYSLPTEIYGNVGPTLYDQLSLPTDAPTVLFVADDMANHRKGFARLAAALPLVAAKLGKTLNCIAIGRGEVPPGLGDNVRYHALGHVADPARMGAAYRTSGCFAIASLEDNFPNTILEARCCGTPVAGYKATGIAEMVQDGASGFLADAESPASLAEAIYKTLTHPWDRPAISAQAHATFALNVQAARYMEVYKSL